MIKRMSTAAAAVAVVATLAACQNQNGLSASSAKTETPAAQLSVLKQSAPIKLNQLGYQPTAQKIAIVPASSATQFSVLNKDDNSIVLTGNLSSPAQWEHSGETVQQADFSELSADGNYIVRVQGVGDSYPFAISNTVLREVHDAAIKSFYLNRASIAIDKKYGGVFARAAGHPDTKVQVHASAATKDRPAGTVLSSPRGWYDAGDYGKYIVNSGISTYTMLMAYQHYGDLYKGNDLNIPESGNGVPDLIDEIKWNLDWMETMQDNDGGVYHKLTTLNFSDLATAPNEGLEQRYMIGKSVTAALDFAAVMAVASRVFEEFEEEFPQQSERYKQRALQAWSWAEANPQATYTQPADVVTGPYGDDDPSDEFAWAAAELYLLTGDSAYVSRFDELDVDPSANLSWPSVAALGYISLTSFGEETLDPKRYAQIKSRLLAAADKQVKVHIDSAYSVTASADDFVWGSNSNILNNGLVLAQAYRLSGDKKYKNAALSTVDYVLGMNPIGYSYVTAYGDLTPMNIHHRPSVADDLVEPVPGFLAGGPHTGRQDSCAYDGDMPATNFADTACSYSTNEIAINWNAPLVYMLAAAISLD